MKEQLITFKTAKLAKEKGFDIPSNHHYYVDGDVSETYNDNIYDKLKNSNIKQRQSPFEKEILMSAPTQSLLQRWLREEHNLHTDVYRCAIGWEVNLEKSNGGTFIKKITEYEEDTYEESLEKGLQAALKLIK